MSDTTQKLGAVSRQAQRRGPAGLARRCARPHRRAAAHPCARTPALELESRPAPDSGCVSRLSPHAASSNPPDIRGIGPHLPRSSPDAYYGVRRRRYSLLPHPLRLIAPIGHVETACLRSPPIAGRAFCRRALPLRGQYSMRRMWAPQHCEPLGGGPPRHAPVSPAPAPGHFAGVDRFRFSMRPRRPRVPTMQVPYIRTTPSQAPPSP